MRATITYEGMTIETEATGAEIRDLLFAIKDGPEKPRVKRGRPRETADVAELNESQLQTWRFLTANDVPGGLTSKEYAEHAGIQVMAADNRMLKLVELGLAHLVPAQRGPKRYRAGAR